MKCIVLFGILAAASAQFVDQYGRTSPVRVSGEYAANTIDYVNEIYPEGSYVYRFNTDNGIAAEAQGTPKAFPGNPPAVPVVSQGSFSWTAPDGQRIAITYVADENGYQPSGDAIPKPPPIPDVILRSIEYNLRNSKQQNK